MGIFDSFFGAPAQSAQQQTPQNPNPQASGVPPQQQQTQQGNGTIPLDPNNPAAQAQPKVEPQSPFEAVKDLWKNDPAATEAANKAANDFLKVDPKQVFEQAGKVDFKQFITKEDMAAMAQGGEAAVAAFANAITRVGQASYATSAIAATEIAKQAVTKSREQMTADLPGMFKNLSVSDSIRTANPALNHEAVAPLVKMVEQQFVQKFPQASPTEITKMASDYMAKVGQAFNPTLVAGDANASGKQGSGAEKEMDWGNFFTI